jgi:hypothetical protein
MDKADSLSDYDLYVYWREPVPLDARKRINEGRASDYQLNNTFWELEDEWIEPGGQRFNVMFRSCREAEEELHRRLVKHLASLGYTTAYCFTLSQGKSLVDPNRWLAGLQHQTQGAYPSGLVQAILRKNRPVLGGGMQSCYLKQINAAIAREDPVSLNHRVAAWLASYFDILFAINGQFHPGEKRLLIYAEGLANLPESALLAVRQPVRLFWRSGSADRGSLGTDAGAARRKADGTWPATLRLTTDENNGAISSVQGFRSASAARAPRRASSRADQFSSLRR